MTRDYSDDEPLDFEAVGADDALIEQLRNSVRRSLSPDDAVVWGDDDLDTGDSDDPSYALLRALQYDVSTELPTGPVLPAEVVPLRASGRSFGRTATVAAITVGVMSLAGVAAAATSQPVRNAVADAVSTVVHAITPDSSVGRTVAGPAAGSVSDTPTATITPPGQQVRDAARSAAAARFIGAALARADRLSKAGQYAAAANLLDAAGRRLPLVTPADGHDALQTLLANRRAELAATATRASASAKPMGKPANRPTAKPHPTKTAGTTSKPDSHVNTPPQKGRGPAATTPTARTHSVPLRLPNGRSTPAAVRATPGR